MARTISWGKSQKNDHSQFDISNRFCPFPLPTALPTTSSIEKETKNIISSMVNSVRSVGDIALPSDQSSDFFGSNIPVQPLLIIGVIVA